MDNAFHPALHTALIWDDPKISARWQLTDWLALRASAGSTFRGPSLPSVTLGSVTSLQNVLGTFRAIDIFGNANLTPESADTINVGAIFETPNFFATVDYWSFDFQDPLVTEPLAGMVAAMFPNGATGATVAPIQLTRRFWRGSHSNWATLRRRTRPGLRGLDLAGGDLQHQRLAHPDERLGRPGAITSVDHGTALDQAGTDRADLGSLRAAVRAALDLVAASRVSAG